MRKWEIDNIFHFSETKFLVNKLIKRRLQMENTWW